MRLLGRALVEAFVVIALVDPESEARMFLEDLVGDEGAIAAAVGAGLLTMIGMYFLVRSPRDQDDQHDGAADLRAVHAPGQSHAPGTSPGGGTQPVQ